MITQEEKARTLKKLEDPTLCADVCAYVSVGNSLIDLCNIWQVTYWTVSNYMYKHHKDEYESAMKTRGEWIDMRILDEIKSIGLVDIRLAYDENGRLKDPREWPDALARAISAVESEDIIQKGAGLVGYTKRIKMWDKLKALELLGRNRGLFKEDNTQGRALVQIFQNLGGEATPVEERINLIESALRNQLKK